MYNLSLPPQLQEAIAAPIALEPGQSILMIGLPEQQGVDWITVWFSNRTSLLRSWDAIEPELLQAVAAFVQDRVQNPLQPFAHPTTGDPLRVTRSARCIVQTALFGVRSHATVLWHAKACSFDNLGDCFLVQFRSNSSRQYIPRDCLFSETPPIQQLSLFHG